MKKATQETGTIMAVMVVFPIPWILSLLLLETPGNHGKLVNVQKHFVNNCVSCSLELFVVLQKCDIV